MKFLGKQVNNFMREVENEVTKYFQCCPLCYADSLIFQWSLLGKDYVLCSSCGAKWHINYGLNGFKWAKLEACGLNEKGSELLDKEYAPKFWQLMASLGRNTTGLNLPEPELERDITEIEYPIFKTSENHFEKVKQQKKL